MNVISSNMSEDPDGGGVIIDGETKSKIKIKTFETSQDLNVAFMESDQLIVEGGGFTYIIDGTVSQQILID